MSAKSIQEPGKYAASRVVLANMSSITECKRKIPEMPFNY